MSNNSPDTSQTTTPRNLTRMILLTLLVIVALFLIAGSTSTLGEGKRWVSQQITTWIASYLSGAENLVVKREVQRVVEEESAVIEIVENASPSVVSVLERSVTFDFFSRPRLTEASIGTGFAVRENLIVTNKHVVNDRSASYTVVDIDGERFEITQLYRDPLNDLAILKVENANFSQLGFSDSDQVKVGQTVIAIGNALGRFSNTVTKGVISGKGRGITASSNLGQFQQELEDVLQTDAALNPGNSGGPLLDLSGQVIGVNVAVGLGTENIGFAIPSNTVKSLISDFEAGRERSRPFLGVRYAIITKELARNSEFPEGALIREVILGSAASKTNLMVNDVITEIEGEAINEDNLLATVILDHKTGDEIEIKVWRNGKEMTLNVVLTTQSIP